MDNRKDRRHFLKYLVSSFAFGAGCVSLFGGRNGFAGAKAGLANINPSEANAGENKAVPSMAKIAVEEHFTTEKTINYTASKAASGAEFNSGISYKMSDHAHSLIGEKRLKDMDEAGIDIQVISPVCFHEGFVDPSVASDVSRVVNDETCRIINQYPKRFAGLAGLACHDPDAAAKELERAVKELGLKGAMIYSHIQGEYLDAKKFWGIFETADRLGVPIYLHPKEPSPDLIKPYLTYPALAGKIWGYAAEAGLHAMRLIASGLFDKYPGLRIILGHGGEGLPALMWRMGLGDNDADGGGPPGGGGGAYAKSPGIPGGIGLNIKKQPGRYVKDNFYVTTSGMFWTPVLNFLHSSMGPDRVLFAVDYPAESNVKAVKSVESMSISNEDKEKIFHLNAERLLKL